VKESEKSMGRITRVNPHLTEEEVKERMRNDPNPLYRERWSIIFARVSRRVGSLPCAARASIGTISQQSMKKVQREAGLSMGILHEEYICCIIPPQTFPVLGFFLD
jgi:hypothetical protein